MREGRMTFGQKQETHLLVFLWVYGLWAIGAAFAIPFL
jgi:hypothetical protein